MIPGFPKLFFQIAPFREYKKAIAPLTHLGPFLALCLQLKNV